MTRSRAYHVRSILKWSLVVWAVLVTGTAFAAEDIHSRAESLVRSGRYGEAEAIYRQALTSSPRDYRIRLGLSRVFLWSGKYADAERAFGELVRERPRDVPALLGFAQTAYWSGDFRSAPGRFQRVLGVDVSNADARQALAELRSVSRPRWEASVDAADDSQPLRRVGGSARVSLFSDPLTRWDVMLRRMDFEDATLNGFGAAVSTSFPPLLLSIDAEVEHVRFPDGESAMVGGLSVGRRVTRHSVVTAAIDRTPVVGTISSLDTHTTATQYRIGWKTDDSARWLAAASAHVVDYSDDNRGNGVDAYLIAPVLSSRFSLSAGLSSAWRDSDENRFRFTTFLSERVASDVFNYRVTGVYDPYWTPHKLLEGRAIVVISTALRKARIKVQADGGYARDEYRSFAPPSGPTPTPSFTVPIMLERTFHPWRASLEGVMPLQTGVELRARYRHEVSAFYRVNEFQASVGGYF